MTEWDDVRPFFGERPETLGENLEPWTPDPVRSGSIEQHRKWRIEAGDCPNLWCAGRLDEGACPSCGWSLLEEQMRERIEEPPEDWLPTLPLALRLDEYAEANVDEDAA